MAKLEEMERLLREAQAEKRSLLEHKVTPGILICFILFIYFKIEFKKKYQTSLANTGSSSWLSCLADICGDVFSCNWLKAAASTQILAGLFRNERWTCESRPWRRRGRDGRIWRSGFRKRPAGGRSSSSARWNCAKNSGHRWGKLKTFFSELSAVDRIFSRKNRPVPKEMLFFSVPPVPPADPLPACAKGRLWPAGSHWVGRPQRRHVLPPVHLWEDVPRLPGQDGRKDQDLEETLVRFRPQPTHALLLRR